MTQQVVVKNGFLVSAAAAAGVHEDEDDNDDSTSPKTPVPLLVSTVKLLTLLGYALPTTNGSSLRDNGLPHPRAVAVDDNNNNNNNNADDDDDDDPGEKSTSQQEDEKEQKEEEQEQQQEEETGGQDDVKEETTDDEIAFCYYKKLKRIENVTNFLINALNDIRDLKYRQQQHHDQNLAKSTVVESSTTTGGGGGGKLSFFDRKNQALEHQRERLQKQLSVGEKSTKNDSVNNSNDKADAEGEGEEKEIQSKDDTTNTEAAAAENPQDLRLARALNSLRILTPILLEALLHERRNDKTIVIGGEKYHLKTKRGRRTSCWFLGEFVYDVMSLDSNRNMYRRLQDIFAFLGMKQEEDITLDEESCKVWTDSIDKAMRCVALQQQEPIDWIDRNPFDNLVEGEEEDDDDDRRVAMTEMGHALDAQFGLMEEKDQDEHEQYLKSIRALHQRVNTLLRHRFPDARLSIYGSCLSDLSLGKNADVDMSLTIEEAIRSKDDFVAGRITPAVYQRDMKRIVYQVCRKLESRRDEFRDMHPVTHARVPVINGTYVSANNPHSPDGSIHFDICFLNDIAVANSSLLREYSLVDPRVKHLMLVVKRWAKDCGICSAQDNCLSSYAWMNLVIFYLQCLGFVPNLQSTELMEKVGFVHNPEDYWHTVNNLKTSYLRWEQAKQAWQQPSSLQSLSVTALFYGFLRFYARDFPCSICVVSIKRGRESVLPKTVFGKCSLFLCIEDPFETYDSHCPHDLGMPANEHGMRKIAQCFQEGEVNLRNILLDTALSNKETAAVVDSLWSAPVAEQYKTRKQRKRENRKKRKDRKAAQMRGIKTGATVKAVEAVEPPVEDKDAIVLASAEETTGGEAKKGKADGEAEQKGAGKTSNDNEKEGVEKVEAPGKVQDAVNQALEQEVSKGFEVAEPKSDEGTRRELAGETGGRRRGRNTKKKRANRETPAHAQGTEHVATEQVAPSHADAEAKAKSDGKDQGVPAAHKRGRRKRRNNRRNRPSNKDPNAQVQGAANQSPDQKVSNRDVKVEHAPDENKQEKDVHKESRQEKHHNKKTAATNDTPSTPEAHKDAAEAAELSQQDATNERHRDGKAKKRWFGHRGRGRRRTGKGGHQQQGGQATSGSQESASSREPAPMVVD